MDPASQSEGRPEAADGRWLPRPALKSSRRRKLDACPVLQEDAFDHEQNGVRDPLGWFSMRGAGRRGSFIVSKSPRRIANPCVAGRGERIERRERFQARVEVSLARPDPALPNRIRCSKLLLCGSPLCSRGSERSCSCRHLVWVCCVSGDELRRDTAFRKTEKAVHAEWGCGSIADPRPLGGPANFPFSQPFPEIKYLPWRCELFPEPSAIDIDTLASHILRLVGG
jgi:hypothetical protein